MVIQYRDFESAREFAIGLNFKNRMNGKNIAYEATNPLKLLLSRYMFTKRGTKRSRYES
jgi:hypothetical protein